MPIPDYRKGVILILIAGAMWGIAGLVIRLMEIDEEWQTLFYRSATLEMTMLAYLSPKSSSGLLKGFLSACWPGQA